MSEHARRFIPPTHPRIAPIPAFTDNYIWLVRADSGARALVVDPGDGEVVLSALAHERLELAAILVTHHHADHVGGLARLRERFPQAQVWGPRNERIDGIDHRVGDGDAFRIDWLDAQWQVRHVPGHTLDHIAYFAPSLGDDPRPVLFCGDTLFAAGCGRLFEGSPQQMMDSLSALLDYPDETLVYCAHEYTQSNLRFAHAVEPGNAAVVARERETAELRAASRPTVPSNLAIERHTNPFLRWRANGVRQAAAARLGRPAESDVEVFTAIREWKNSFRG